MGCLVEVETTWKWAPQLQQRGITFHLEALRCSFVHLLLGDEARHCYRTLSLNVTPQKESHKLTSQRPLHCPWGKMPPSLCQTWAGTSQLEGKAPLLLSAYWRGLILLSWEEGKLVGKAEPEKEKAGQLWWVLSASHSLQPAAFQACLTSPAEVAGFVLSLGSFEVPFLEPQ